MKKEVVGDPAVEEPPEEQLTVWHSRSHQMDTVNGYVRYEKWCCDFVDNINRATGRLLYVKSNERDEVSVFEQV